MVYPFKRRGRDTRNDEFIAYYTARGASIRATAYLLCHDWHLAEDLTQTTFIKLYHAWHRVSRHEVLDQYARKVLLRTFLDERRRPWRREHAVVPHSVRFDVEVHDPNPETKLRLKQALATIPKGQRAMLVLRFWADLPVEEVAAIMDCTPGTVKSQTARGLEKLRSVLGAPLDWNAGGGEPR